MPRFAMKIWATVAAATCSFLSGSHAQASSTAAGPLPSLVQPHGRLFVGASIGVEGARMFRGGEPANGEGGGRLAGEVGWTAPLRFVPLAVTTLARAGIWGDWANPRNESRSSWDFAVGPTLAFEEHNQGAGSWRRVWRCSLPLGPSYANIETTPGVRVADLYGPGVGFNMGLVGGVDFFSKHSGLYVEGALIWRWLQFAHDEWLRSDPNVASHDQIRFSGLSFMLTGGMFYRL